MNREEVLKKIDNIHENLMKLSWLDLEVISNESELLRQDILVDVREIMPYIKENLK